MKVKIKRLSKDAVLPYKAHATDAGMDMVAVKDYVIPAHGRCLVDTGIAMAIPRGYYGMVVGRSGNTIKRGLVGQTGIVDCGYEGSIGVMAFNTTDEDIVVKQGERVGQIILMAYPDVLWEEVEELAGTTKRGDEGFGSTGK